MQFVTAAALLRSPFHLKRLTPRHSLAYRPVPTVGSRDHTTDHNYQCQLATNHTHTTNYCSYCSVLSIRLTGNAAADQRRKKIACMQKRMTDNETKLAVMVALLTVVHSLAGLPHTHLNLHLNSLSFFHLLKDTQTVPRISATWKTKWNSQTGQLLPGVSVHSAHCTMESNVCLSFCCCCR